MCVDAYADASAGCDVTRSASFTMGVRAKWNALILQETNFNLKSPSSS